MASLKSIHHINFIVKDLAIAVRTYEEKLGIGPFEYTPLEARGVSTARVKIGDVWIVLVSPDREDSIPGRYLKEHGEGFFLMSFGVENIDTALKEFSERGVVPANSIARTGIMGWRIADLDTINSLGAMFHLTEIE